MHLTDSKKAAAESRGITFPAFSTAFLQTLFQPHTAPPLFILACQKQMTNTFVPPSAGVCGSLYKGWWKQRSVIIVFFWGFLRIMCGCIWTVSRIVMGWFLEIIAERTKRALRTPFSRKKKTGRADLTLDISQPPWDGQYSIRQLSQNWLSGCCLISRRIWNI